MTDSAVLLRPAPPLELLTSYESLFIPAPEVVDWAMSTFIEDGATLRNDDHSHLAPAKIGMLWTNVGNKRQGRAIVGQAELGEPRAFGRWPKGRAEQQLREWFGEIPDFVITLSAGYAASVGDAEFCALVEHELYHCGQERDLYGAPKFRQSGLPAYAMRGHDIEEFIGVVRRYGAQAAGITELIEAAQRQPEVMRASIAQVCGTCQQRAA